MQLFNFISPFEDNGRANRLKEYTLYMPASGNDPIRWLSLCGPKEASKQVIMASKGAGHEVPLPSIEKKQKYTHEIEFPSGVTADALAVAAVLKEVLSLRVGDELDCAIALDWYKVPDPAVNSTAWNNTEIGDLIYKGKYYGTGQARNEARNNLVRRMAWFINSHPLYRDSNRIATVPGHNADGSSFGEKLAAAVAGQTQKNLVSTVCTSGPRPSSKEDSASAAAATFEMPYPLDGSVIILDDVYRTGATMRNVASAIRRAGAQRVLGLAAVRTMRN
ncbi:phosphoribosyltransferase [Nonomuraea sp. NPDC049158]|uniref:phosphoribosyltransferase n=1 Tax=Nonomuraea sp. NPDC049158 TaxID=3155649 RepID=UPI003407C774